MHTSTSARYGGHCHVSFWNCLIAAPRQCAAVRHTHPVFSNRTHFCNVACTMATLVHLYKRDTQRKYKWSDMKKWPVGCTQSGSHLFVSGRYHGAIHARCPPCRGCPLGQWCEHCADIGGQVDNPCGWTAMTSMFATHEAFAGPWWRILQCGRDG
jgi:hypothetical protein